MITISRKAKLIATVLHLAIVSIIISYTISERNALLAVSNAFVNEVGNENLKPVGIEVHRLLQANDTKLALIIVTAIIAQFVIIAIKQVAPKIAQK
ncbi:MAG: hypothetical protein EOO45_04490 [Flavobacterium sp.]|nr:MAG: hypothetical protein EOO45_04490 [Flavobacterium sp.]